MHLCVYLPLYVFMHACVRASVCVCVLCVCVFVFVFLCFCAQLGDHQVSPQVRVEMMWAFEIVPPDKGDIVAG